MSDKDKFKSAIKGVKVIDSVEQDVLNAISALLSKGDIAAASELWGEYVDISTKKQIYKKFKDVESIFESDILQQANIRRILSEIRATRTGRVDFRTKIGKASKDYIAKVLSVSNDDTEVSSETDVEVGTTDIVSEAVAIQKAKKGTKVTFWFDKGRVPVELTINKITGNEIELLDSDNEPWVVTKNEFRDRQIKESELIEFNEELNEKIVRSINSKGKVTKKLDRKTRARKANQNSRLSKSERKRVARKAARTRKRDKSGTRKAQIKRKKALKKRASRGIKDNR